MLVVKIIFWVCAAALFYCYLGYGLLLHLLTARKKNLKKAFTASEDFPHITLVIPAYNEEAMLEQKLCNSLALDYPAEKLNIIVVADGSDDATLTILNNYPQVQVVYQETRRGKSAAIHHAMQYVQTPVVVYSDADSLLNADCLKEIAAFFKDKKIGGVAGEKRISAIASGVGSAEGLYWQYESRLKKVEAKFYSVVGAAGELFALRTALYTPLADDIILDDFFLSLHICLQGYKVAYAADAWATEPPTASLAEESKRKVRIAAGAFQILSRLPRKGLLSYPVLAFQFYSRRWLRWVASPLAILLLIITNIILSLAHSHFYTLFLLLQGIFYLLALVGWLMLKSNKKLMPATAVFYFLFMNYCLLQGMIKFFAHRQTVLWPKAKRQL